ncbi:MAG: folylpolyglutamate synthase/dihydrofolate synthase family protein [Pseudomonadales bacterium]
MAVSNERSLDQWLDYIESLHPVEIDMGLERIMAVARKMHLHIPAAHVITVAGTNGKGSTAIAMEQLLLQPGAPAGRRVGTTVSPHIEHFSERIRVQGEAVPEALIVAAFTAIERDRDAVPLTYFEFATLAALWCFRACEVSVMILEIGLGGRLDAFNIVDAHTAIITSIGLDHQSYLGNDRESIGLEKAGILRAGQRVCLGPDMPDTVRRTTQALGLAPLAVGAQLAVAERAGAWSLQVTEQTDADPAWQVGPLPVSGFNVANCALAVAAVWPLLTPAQQHARQLARWAEGLGLPGRCETRPAWGRQWLLDVGHNALAAGHLLNFLRSRMPSRRVVAVYGVLADKPAEAMAQALAGRVTHWVLVPTDGTRGQSAAALAERLQPLANVHQANSVDQGLRMARALTGPADQILVWGSFSVVAQARTALAHPVL